MSRTSMIYTAVIVTLITTGAVLYLWWPATSGLNGAALVSARFDGLKIGLSVGVGLAGLFALYLSWRRQRSTEADLDNRERALALQQQVAADTKTHQERLAEDDRVDAIERRITELYTKAVEQLGSDKAPVRLGGLYALERLGQDNPSQRATIFNVICAYLRMPFDVPTDGGGYPIEDHEGYRQEKQVRLTAQSILAKHRRLGDRDQDSLFWNVGVIDLSGANLAGATWPPVDLSYADLTGADLSGAFLVSSDLRGASLMQVNCINAYLKWNDFSDAGLQDANFAGAELEQADFSQARLSGNSFRNAKLSLAKLRQARFAESADFTGASGDAELPAGVVVLPPETT